MAILTTVALWFASAAMFTTVVNELRHAGDLIGWREMKPVNRTVMQTYTTDYTQAETDRYITQTVREIYGGALAAAALRKEGYSHAFKPLLPIHVYPLATYVPKILEQLRGLFPECDIEMNRKLGVYVIKWF
uniref:Uncharacterized protein n=1 Tax=viral metagenome TaxID=1070528 RepID=A0A6C0DSB1_9ZZZZ